MATLQEALADLLRSSEGKAPKKDKTVEEEREMAKSIAKALPEPVFPHGALKKKQKQREELDEQTKE